MSRHLNGHPVTRLDLDAWTARECPQADRFAGFVGRPAVQPFQVSPIGAADPLTTEVA